MMTLSLSNFFYTIGEMIQKHLVWLNLFVEHILLEKKRKTLATLRDKLKLSQVHWNPSLPPQGQIPLNSYHLNTNMCLDAHPNEHTIPAPFPPR